MKLNPVELYGRRQGLKAGGCNSKGLAEGKWRLLVTGPRDILRLASGKRVESCQYRHWMEIQAKEI